MLNIKRVYESAANDDGYRILVDRVWPRGISKEKAALDLWLKEVGPSTELRKSFGHVPEKYPAFMTAYQAELAKNPAYETLVATVTEQLKKGNVTLLYGAKDEVHNQAVVLLEMLNKIGLK